MWSEEVVRAWTRVCVDKHYYVTPSAVVMKSHYYDSNNGWRFDKMRSVVENEIMIYKQR